MVDGRKVPNGSLFATPQPRGYKRARFRPLPAVARMARPELALDGGSVAAMIDVENGPQVGAALRWLHAQVDDNPELNTRAALSALLRFAPRSAWDTGAPAALRASSRPERACKPGLGLSDADRAPERAPHDGPFSRLLPADPRVGATRYKSS